MRESKEDLEERIQSDVQREILTIQDGLPRPYSLIFFDVDHFKAFNDLHSYPQGDEVLDGIQYCVRKMHGDGHFVGVYGNYGGDEFLIALPAVTIDDAVSMAQKLQRAVHEHEFKDVEKGIRFQELVTLSIGISVVDLLQYMTQNPSEPAKKALDDLLHQSNVALDYGKVLGEGGVHVFREFLDKEWSRMKEFRKLYFSGPFSQSFDSVLNSTNCPEEFKTRLQEDFSYLRKRLTQKDTRTLAKFADLTYRQHLLTYSGDKDALITQLQKAADCQSNPKNDISSGS